MKNIITLLLVTLSITLFSQVHTREFFKKTTNKKVNITEYLISEGFKEFEVKEQDKIDMLTKPNDGMLESLQSTFKAYVNNKNEIVYLVSVKCSTDETINDRLGIAFRITYNMPRKRTDYIVRRNEVSYLRTTENGNKCAYLLVPYGMDYYPKNKL
tara:strand:- start:538 stop:1005 length:468 start_codon:yes stop_codon:yes gene_type:complete